MANKDGIGRPLKFKTPEDLQEGIDAYFEQCDNNTKEVITKSGEIKTIKAPIPYTIEGLAVALGIDRDTLLNYGKREIFFGTVKRAKEKVLKNLWERSLMGDNVPSMTIFNLKNNYNYVDKKEQQVDVNTKGSVIILPDNGRETK